MPSLKLNEIAGLTLDDEYVIRRPLTGEIANIGSPVRLFLDQRFSYGKPRVQRLYRDAGPSLAIAPADRSEVNPGTLGTAADWLLRFLIHPRPDLDLAMYGASTFEMTGVRVGTALADIATGLGMTLPSAPRQSPQVFAGPVPGNTADPERLARSCWVLALMTEAFRGGPFAVVGGRVWRYRGAGITGEDLLGMTPPLAVIQLAAFRAVFQESLLPVLALRIGTWAIGPTFIGSELLHADADLVAGRMLLELKTSAKRLSLGIRDLFQLIGYALLDFTNEYRLDSIAIFSARYGYLATWPLQRILEDLAGEPVDLQATRVAFQALLMAHQPPPKEHARISDLRARVRERIEQRRAARRQAGYTS
jgi:hypothetical protein